MRNGGANHGVELLLRLHLVIEKFVRDINYLQDTLLLWLDSVFMVVSVKAAGADIIIVFDETNFKVHKVELFWHLGVSDDAWLNWFVSRVNIFAVIVNDSEDTAAEKIFRHLDDLAYWVDLTDVIGLELVLRGIVVPAHFEYLKFHEIVVPLSA